MANEAPPIGEPGFDLYADQGDRIRASNITFIIIPTVFVILRLVSRKISRAGYWWDDLLIVLALLLSYALPILNLISIPRGFGRHIWILPIDSTSMFLKTLWVFEFFFGLTICFNKLSILAFYRRIFPIAQLRIVLLIMTAVVLCFTVTFVTIVIFQCVPIHAFWDLEDRVLVHARCVNVNLLFLVAGGVNCALDALIVFMPLPLLWRLRTTKGQKLTLTSIFTVAGFVCLCSIIRLIVLSRLEDVDLTWNYVNAGIWTATEPTMGVVSACLPSLRPLLKRLVSNTYHGPTFKGTRNKSAQDYGSGTSSRYMWSRNKGEDGDLRSFTRLEETGVESNTPWGHNVHVHGGKKQRGNPDDQISLEEMQTPSRRIKVKTEVTLISTERLEYRDQLF